MLIAEKIEEEDKMSDFSDDDKKKGKGAKGGANQGKKNYLQKNILEQTK